MGIHGTSGGQLFTAQHNSAANLLTGFGYRYKANCAEPGKTAIVSVSSMQVLDKKGKKLRRGLYDLSKPV